MDRIVAATQFRDFILVFTEQGTVYRVYWDDFSRMLTVEKHIQIGLNR